MPTRDQRFIGAACYQLLEAGNTKYKQPSDFKAENRQPGTFITCYSNVNVVQLVLDHLFLDGEEIT